MLEAIVSKSLHHDGNDAINNVVTYVIPKLPIYCILIFRRYDFRGNELLLHDPRFPELATEPYINGQTFFR